ncbi:hypothetical protein NDU88_002987 [Pleurodeles waltl]|uniref:Uncharacterized protein n=1 Tax=Pleurodeles waltl TaxID=8319 RepID=A0AAV7VGN2_PLEWA|nr:hypothetical protein NDU88_002987 [Pleurodeles waltl]
MPTRAAPRRDLSHASGTVSYSTTRLGNLPASYLQGSASAATPFLGLGRLARPARLEHPRGSVFTPGPAGVHRRSDLYPWGLGFSCFPRGFEESGIARRIIKDLSVAGGAPLLCGHLSARQAPPTLRTNY